MLERGQLQIVVAARLTAAEVEPQAGRAGCRDRAQPAQATLFTAVVDSGDIERRNALALEANDKSAASIGQFAALYHSPSKPRLSASAFASTLSLKLADSIVAPSGNADVSNRSNPANTWKLPNTARRATVKNEFVVKNDTDPEGGYPPLCGPCTHTLPSSPPAPTANVNVPDVGCATTTAVAAELADAEPTPFDAVTTARNVEPTSAATTTYVAAVAPPISTHPAPPASHRRHRYAYEIGAVPDHDPADDDNVRPTSATPDTTGTTEFAGAAGSAAVV